MSQWVQAVAAQGLQPEFNPHKPHKGSRTPTSSPLASSYTSQTMVHGTFMHTLVHTYTHVHTHTHTTLYYSIPFRHLAILWIFFLLYSWAIYSWIFNIESFFTYLELGRKITYKTNLLLRAIFKFMYLRYYIHIYLSHLWPLTSVV